MSAPENPSGAAREFLELLLALHRTLFPDGEHGSLTLPALENLDIAPLRHCLDRLDREGPDSLSALTPGEMALAAHRLEALLPLLAPFAREDGPLAGRIRSLKGEGPFSAYRKASREGRILFEHKVIGRL